MYRADDHTFDLEFEVENNKGIKKFRELWQKFTSIFNCLPNIWHASKTPVETSGLRSSMIEVCIEFCFSCLPFLPSEARWTKRGPSIDWFLKTIATIPVLALIWDFAFKKSPEVPKRPNNVDEEEQSWLETVAWHVVANKRVTRGGIYLRKKDISESEDRMC